MAPQQLRAWASGNCGAHWGGRPRRGRICAGRPGHRGRAVASNGSCRAVCGLALGGRRFASWMPSARDTESRVSANRERGPCLLEGSGVLSLRFSLVYFARASTRRVRHEHMQERETADYLQDRVVQWQEPRTAWPVAHGKMSRGCSAFLQSEEAEGRTPGNCERRHIACQ